MKKSPVRENTGNLEILQKQEKHREFCMNVEWGVCIYLYLMFEKMLLLLGVHI